MTGRASVAGATTMPSPYIPIAVPILLGGVALFHGFQVKHSISQRYSFVDEVVSLVVE